MVGLLLTGVQVVLMVSAMLLVVPTVKAYREMMDERREAKELKLRKEATVCE